MSIVQIVTCVKILYLEFFFSLGCVTVGFYYWENIVHWGLRYFWKVLFSLRICIHLINKLHCNFAFFVETVGTVRNCVSWKTALLWKIALLENCVTLKNCVALKNCVTWKTVLFWKTALLEKLCCFENCITWKTVLLWKTALLEKCIALKTALL